MAEDAPQGEPKTDPRFDNPRFQGEQVWPYERLVRPLWPLRYRPKRPRLEPGQRVRGWFGRRRWESGESVVALYRDDR